jgi:outer membrane protein TolC
VEKKDPRIHNGWQIGDLGPVRREPHPVTRHLLPFVGLLLGGCLYQPEPNKQSADEDVYGILGETTKKLTGAERPFAVERPVDTLRKQLQASAVPVTLTLAQALDVAAENNRDYQTQKERLYVAALNLTRSQNDFAWRWAGGGSASLDGEAELADTARLSDDLGGSANSVYGTRVVGSFVQTFLRSVLSGGSFDGGSILDLTITQPLLRTAGRRVAREPLTQAERNVVYALRDYERFRSQFVVALASDYWNITRQMRDLVNVEANYVRLRDLRTQVQALFDAGRRTVTDLGRAQQDVLTADAQRVSAAIRLQAALDRYKLLLGLPTAAQLQLDIGELDALVEQGVSPIELPEERAIDLSLTRRYDHLTTIDSVADAGRRVFVAEDALNLQLDLTTNVQVPSESGKGLDLDWSRVNWRAGFDLDLALNRVPSRNVYRAALITFDQAIRAREQSEDQLTVNVRNSLRNIQAALQTFRIQTTAVDVADSRVQATTDLYDAGRIQVLEKLDAQRSLLNAQLARNAAIVDFSIARLQLMNDLEAIRLEPQGFRFDTSLPMPQAKTAE